VSPALYPAKIPQKQKKTGKLYPAESNVFELANARKMYELNSNKADIYYAYHTIYSFIKEPFTTHHPESVFNTARFLMQKMQFSEPPPGVFKSFVLWAMAEQATKLGCFKVARRALDELASLKLAPSWQDKVDLACIRIRGKPLSDKDEMLSGEDVFTGVRSFINFEVLPIVEFELAPGIAREEAQALISKFSSAGASNQRGPSGRHGGNESNTRSGNMLTFDDEDDDQTIGRHMGSDDPLADFNQKLLSATSDNLPKADRNLLSLLSADQVVVQHSGYHGVADRYFRVMMEDTMVVVCRACGRMFAEEDLEIEYLKKPHCVFCRSTEADDILWACNTMG